MALVIDIPLCPMEVPEEKRCVHVSMAGERCPREVSMQERCEVHYQWFVSKLGLMGVPFPEDSMSLQVMLMKALEMVAAQKLEQKRVTAMVEICKMMANNVRWYQHESQEADRVARARGLKAAASE